MSRVNLGVKPYTTPQPVWILAAYDENGVANAMNAEDDMFNLLDLVSYAQCYDYKKHVIMMQEANI